jgi:hypothetical protein
MEAGSAAGAPNTSPTQAQHKARIAAASSHQHRIASTIEIRLAAPKDSDEEEVILRRRKTTSERSQRRERDQFP